MSDLEYIKQRLADAHAPEDIFGALEGDPATQLAEAKKVYHRLARMTHPDAHYNGNHKIAEQVFRDLTRWWEIAQRQIANGTYGTGAGTTEPIRIQTRRHEYVVEDRFAQGDLCNLYHCSYTSRLVTEHGIFKVVRDPADNDLVENEARCLRQILQGDEGDKYHAYFPALIDSFLFEDADTRMRRQANVLSWTDGLYSLKAVHDTYPDGLDPRDMAWMWRRLLVALGYAHRQGVIHGAVLPTHVLIQPEAHGLVLVDWSYAVTHGARITAVSAPYESWYGPEVLKKEAPKPGLDIYMGARCMVYLLGGDPVSGLMPGSVPKPIQSFFKGCSLQGPAMRPQDAWKLLEEFDELLGQLWGPRKFRPFVMPTRKGV